MTKVIASFALMILVCLNMLGNFWFTYGIWPHSWGSFVLFFITGFILSTLLGIVATSKS